MSNTLIASLGGIWALLIWGACDWLIARSSKKTDEFELFLSLQLTGLLVAFVALFLGGLHLPSVHDSLIMLAAGIAFGFAFLSFIKGLATGAAGIVIPASSTFPLFTLLLSAIFLSIRFTGLQISAMVITVVGVVLLAYEKRQKKISVREQHQATIFAVAAAFMWGIGNVIQNIVIANLSWQSALFLIDVGMTFMGFIFLLAEARGSFGRKVKNSYKHKNALLVGGIYTVGSFGFYFGAVKLGNVLIPLVISSASPLITSGLSALYDGEKLGAIKRLGAVVAIAGIILLNL